MVQIFQRGSKFFSKISSGGSLFIKKLVPGGTNFGGSIFTMTWPYFIIWSVSQSVSQKIDDLSVIATCRSDTSATLSSDVKGSVVHKSTRE